MAQVSFSSCLQQIESGKIAQSYLLIGENYFQRFLLTNKIVDAKLPKSERLLNKYETGGTAAKPQVLEDYLFSVQLLGGNQVVILTDLNRLPAKSQQYLVKVIDKLDSSVTLIASAKKLDGRKSFAKSLAKNSVNVKIKELNSNELTAFVKSRFSRHGLKIDELAVRNFCHIVGADCGDIENEINKIAINYIGKTEISAQEIVEYLSNSRSFSQFEVADYFANRQLNNTLKSMLTFLESGGYTAAGSLIWSFYGKLERLFMYKKYKRILSRNDLAAKVRTHPFYLKEFEQQAALWKKTELLDAMSVVFETESEIRFSAETPQQILERAVIKLLRGE